MPSLPVASHTPAVAIAAAPSRGIAGNDVTYGTRALATVSYADALRTVLDERPVEAYSRDTKRLIAAHEGSSAHGFIAAAQAAYAGHYPAPAHETEKIVR